jgi:DNA-binding Lrp family transcriptional regulator
MLLDNVDRKLIEALMNNGRASMRQLAVEVDVALGTIANRMKRLEQEGIIQGYNVILDPAKVGWEMTIIVGLKITKGRMIEVQKRIAKDPRVFLVYDVTGDFDSFVIAKVQNTEDLNDLTKGVLTSEGIERSLTHVVLNTVKETTIALPKY